jgi:hypothetical protein
VATNSFSQTAPEILAPYTRAVLVTPDDENDLAEVTRALQAEGSGSHHNVNVLLVGDTDPVVLVCARGTILPIRVVRVYSTSTSATTVTALY